MAGYDIDQLNIRVVAENSEAASSINMLTASFTQLNATLNSTGSAYNKVNNLTGKLSKGFKKLLTTVTGYASLSVAVWTITKKAFKASTSYEETLNKLNVAMGDGAQAAKEYAEAVQDAVGIDAGEWMNYQGTFNTMIRGFGVAKDQAKIMSQNLTQLAYDYSSLYDESVESAFDKLNSAMAGQIKGLKDYGNDVSVAAIKQTALKYGIDETFSSLDRSTQAFLRYQTIMENASEIGVFNDMSRTILTPANSFRVLTAQATLLWRALGNIASVIYTKIAPALQIIVKWATAAANAIAKLFGFELANIDYSNVNYGSLGVDDLTDDLDDATASAKKLKKQLMGFDELNIIHAPDTSGSSGNSSTGIDTSNWDLMTYDFLKGLNNSALGGVEEKMKSIAKWAGVIAAALVVVQFITLQINKINLVRNISGLTPILTATIDKLLFISGGVVAVLGIVKEIKGVISAWFDGLNLSNFEDMVGGGAVLIAGATVMGAAVGKAFGVAFEGACVFGGFAAVLAGVPMFITGLKDALTNGLNKINAVLMPLGTALVGAGIGALIGGPVTAGIGAIIGLAAGCLADIGVLIYEKWDEIKAFLKPFTDWLYVNIVQPIISFIQPISDAVSEFFSLLTGKVSEIAGGIKAAAVSIFDKAREIFGKIVEIFVALGKSAYTYMIEPLFEWIGELAPYLYDYFIKPFVDKLNWLKTIAVTILTGIGPTVVNFITGLFKSVINGVLITIETNLNNFIWLLNSAIKLINKIPGVNIGQIGYVDIPLMASGGTVDTGQMFIAREAGPELVGRIGNKTAVANNDQIVAAVSAGVYNAMMKSQGANGGTANIHVTVEVDGDTLGKKVIKYHNGVVKQTGASPLMV